MYTVTNAVLMDNEPVWNVLPGFVTAKNKFNLIWLDIDPDAAKQLAGTGTASDTKSSTRTLLTGFMLRMNGNMHAYAIATGNMALRSDTNISESTLDRLRDNTFLMTAKMTRELAITNAAGLTDYGVTDAFMAQFTQAIKDYSDGMPGPRKAISLRSTATKGIKEKIAACNEQLLIMDKLMENFRETNPQFVSDYFSARMIIDLGHRHAKPTPVAGITAAKANS